MQIQNRLKKLEQTSSAANTGFCLCNGGAEVFESYFQKGDDPPMSNGKEYVEGDINCDKCKRPINRRVVIVEFVESGGASKYPDAIPATFNIATKQEAS